MKKKPLGQTRLKFDTRAATEPSPPPVLSLGFGFVSLKMSGSNVRRLNPDAKVSGKDQALAMNINAARSLQMLLKTNLGPKGTLKM